jgi:hypothetical protein
MNMLWCYVACTLPFGEGGGVKIWKMAVLVPSAERNYNMKYNMKPTLLDPLDSVNVSPEVLKCAAHSYDTRTAPIYYCLIPVEHTIMT